MKQFLPFSKQLASIAILITLSSSVMLRAQTTHKVEVTNNVFTPKHITINAGDIVEWTNSQGFHNVNGQKSVFPNNPESFGNATGIGWTYSFTFTKEGLYDYQCDPHIGFDMVGTVTVVDDSDYLSLKVNFMDMNPHIGQMFTMYIKNISSGEYVDIIQLRSIPGSDFDLETDMIEIGESYQIDFYADHNGNGEYDAPPVDHAWRMEVFNVTEDMELNFTHNFNLVDIMAGATGIDSDYIDQSDFIKAYPNPFTDILRVELNNLSENANNLSLINIAGQEMKNIYIPQMQKSMDINVQDLAPGIYFLGVKNGDKNKFLKLIKSY